jgi:lysophospholipase L1-like esterase
VKLRSGTWANLALATGSVLATLVVLVAAYEVAANVRYYRWHAQFDNEGWLGRLTVRSPNPVLLWEYRPYGEAAGIATNRYGFRDVDYPSPAKPDGTHRIAFIGDSVTLGMGVPPRETFVARVAAIATTSGPPVQTLNFSVDGYNALQIRELLTAKVLAFQPDEVVYVLCLNDFDFSDSSGRKIGYFRKPWFFLPQDLERRYRSLIGAEFHRYHFQRHRAEVFRALEEMAAILAARHAAFHLVVMPVFPDKPGDPAYFDHYPLLDVHQEILRFAGQHGILACDLLEDFQRQPPPPERYVFDLWHLNPEGHRVVAESLGGRLAAAVTPSGRDLNSRSDATPSETRTSP